MAFGAENCFEHQNSKVSKTFFLLPSLQFKQLMALANDLSKLQMQNEVYKIQPPLDLYAS
jgi:hypothetical protein